MEESPRIVMERLGRIQNLDRSFDVEFWQRQGPAVIFSAAWEMVVDAYRLKRKSVSEVEFQRTLENLQRTRRSRRSALCFPESVPKTSPPRDCVIRSESHR